MGYAKYTEDNIEIWTDRQYMRSGWCPENGERNTYSESFVFERTSVHIQRRSVYKTVIMNEFDEDKYLFCRECKKMFVFPISSQKAYAAKDWEEPKRCKDCRKKRQVA